jgi:hypothetical protein
VLLQSYIFGLIGIQAVLFFHQQSQKYEVRIVTFQVRDCNDMGFWIGNWIYWIIRIHSGTVANSRTESSQSSGTVYQQQTFSLVLGS